MFGGEGDDDLFSGPGDDGMEGEAGTDEHYGGRDDDFIDAANDEGPGTDAPTWWTARAASTRRWYAPMTMCAPTARASLS